MVYKYSPIKSIYIKNFRNLGEVKLDFDESPIIALRGENESGKTSTIKAFAVCALNAWARDQKDFIRDGTNGFGVAIELEDGTTVTRIKTKTLNQYTVKYPNGEVYETTKIDVGSPLPPQVQEVMGLIEEPETKEYLHIRTYEDQLLFVVTPASTNYKVMYNALKVEQLTKAIKIGSQEVNKLKNDISNNELAIEKITESLKGIKLYDLEPLINIKNRLQQQLSILDKLERAKELLDKINTSRKQLGALDLIDQYNIKEVNIVEADKLNTISRLINKNKELNKKLEILNKVNALENIDVTIVNKLRDTLAKRDNLSYLINKMKIYEGLEGLEVVEDREIRIMSKGIEIKRKIERSRGLLDILDKVNVTEIEQKEFDILAKILKAIQLRDRNNQINQWLVQIDNYVTQVENYLKQIGAKVITCTKCGEQLVVDTETMDVS